MEYVRETASAGMGATARLGATTPQYDPPMQAEMDTIICRVTTIAEQLSYAISAMSQSADKLFGATPEVATSSTASQLRGTSMLDVLHERLDGLTFLSDRAHTVAHRFERLTG